MNRRHEAALLLEIFKDAVAVHNKPVTPGAAQRRIGGLGQLAAVMLIGFLPRRRTVL